MPKNRYVYFSLTIATCMLACCFIILIVLEGITIHEKYAKKKEVFFRNKTGKIKKIPFIYAITPTYFRLTQKAELTRLIHTLRLVPNLHWIVIEDSHNKTQLVTNLLKRSAVNVTHLNIATNKKYERKLREPRNLYPRGVAQRNLGLTWIRKNVPKNSKGVVYFMDDDNAYSLKLFEEMRHTRRASIWPVGFAGGLRFEGPCKCENGKVLKWRVAWAPDRSVPTDMAGFSLNLKLIFQYPNALFSNTDKNYLESNILTNFHITRNDLEAKAESCTEILVWHTQTKLPNLRYEPEMLKIEDSSSSSIEV